MKPEVKKLRFSNLSTMERWILLREIQEKYKKAIKNAVTTLVFRVEVWALENPAKNLEKLSRSVWTSFCFFFPFFSVVI